MIYVIMRIVEGPTEENNFDIPLLLSVHVCTSPIHEFERNVNDYAQAVASTLDERMGGDKMKHALRGDEQDWKQWIFHESRRRQVAPLESALFQLTVSVTEWSQLPI